MNYFIEGLQGSGKSTLVKMLGDKHPECIVLLEGDYSPVELAWCAYMTREQYEEKLAKYSEIKDEIIAKTYDEGNMKVVCYTRILTDIPGFHKDFEQFEIYNGRKSLEDFKKIVLGRYRAFTGDNLICECSLFQNTVEDMILFRNASDEEIISFYKEVAECLKDVPYHIYYIKADDIRANINVIRKERSDEAGNELWFPLMLGFFNESVFAKKNGISGEEAMLDHFAHRQELELRVLNEVFAGKYTVLRSKAYSEKDI